MVKKVTKKFDSFENEEKWLTEMAREGWRLEGYDAVEIEECTYKFVEDPKASEYKLISVVWLWSDLLQVFIQ